MRQQQRRRRKKNYSIQIIWGMVAIVTILGLIVGFKLGFSDNNNNDTIVNAADHPADGDKNYVTLTTTPTTTPTATPTATITPTPTLVPTQVVEPTKAVTPTPQVLNEIDSNQEDINIDNDNFAATPEEESTKEVQKMVALTFDDGPYPPVTERILKVLKDNDSHATFFVVGNRMETYAQTVQQAFEEGNQIGNHTFSHKDLTKLKVNEIEYEVEYSNDLINENADVGNAYFRPPYGAKSDIVKSTVKVPLIFWSVDSLDWKSRDKDAIYKEIMGTVKDGDIILMHDLYPTTADAMEKVIPALISEGYKLVTVQELLEAKGIAPEAGTVYYNGR